MNNTVFKTVISGTLVFVIGQTLQNFVLKSIQDHKKVVGEIDNKLKFYANILTNFGFNGGFNGKIVVEVTDKIRALSCDFESSYKQIPLKWFFSKIGVIVDEKSAGKVASYLIYLSNAGGRKDDRIDSCNDAIEKIREILKIKSLG